MVLAGLTAVADWIGSCEEHFPFAGTAVDLKDYAGRAAQKAKDALDRLGWTGWSPPERPKTISELFPKIREIRPLQRAVVELAARLAGPGMVLLEAPMGEGKTEAAMFLADHWAVALRQRGCYFALPTQATSNQMFGRVRDFLTARYPCDNRVQFHLLHGHASLSAEFEVLREQGARPFELGNICDERKAFDCAPANVVASEWFTHRKRGLLAPFGVGTVDQALLAVLQTKHVFVRLFGLAHKTVIIDEVHAYDAYMSTLVERLLEWLAALGCSVVLLSATLPKSKRQALLKAYAGADATQPEESPYPRLSWVQGREVRARTFPSSKATTRTLQIKWRAPELSSLASTLKDALADGGCAAVVCNTVKRAQEAYLALKRALPPEQLDLFHAQFPFSDRDEREKRTLKRFGRPDDSNVKRPYRFVLVATQVIEQSLDIDFDLMVSELSPVDLVLQRAGRLHRHKRERPRRLAEPELSLIQPEMSDSGVPDFGPSQHVYAPHILLRSWLALRDRQAVGLPADMKRLIESVYDDDMRCLAGLTDPLKDALKATGEALDRKREDRAAKANAVAILPPNHDDDILEAFNLQLEEENPALHSTLQALTRDTDMPSVAAVCLYGARNAATLDPEGHQRVDLEQKPDLAITKALLERSLSIAHKAISPILLGDESFATPGGWRKSPLLRHHRALFFDACRQCSVARYRLVLDPELGLTITKSLGSDAMEGE